EIFSQVITNKKLIQKARAQTIAKLVQKLRKSKDGLAKNPDSEREKIRLRKNSECLAQLKTLKCLDIVRQSLLQEGTNPNTVIASERSTPDELGIAMLRLNKIMHGLVDTFVGTLKLSTDKEAKWREEILETSKRRFKIERTEEKKRKRKELKDQKAHTKNRLEWLEQNKVAGPEGTEVKTKEAEVGQVQTEQENQSASQTEKQQSEVSKNDGTTNATKPEKPQPSKKNKNERKPLTKTLKPQRAPQKESLSGNDENKQDSQEKQTLRDIKPKEIRQKPTEVKERKPKLRSDRKQSIEEESKPDKHRPTHVVDPFFITESGQPYLSTAVVHSEDNESEAEEEQRPPPVKRYRSDEQRGSNYHERPERQPAFGAKKPHDDRHPSWVAKQQQKPIIGDFRGKKITFGEDGQAAEIRTPKNNRAPAADAPASTEGMHPSWVAKQKWKPKIADFQGTKIKFDED
ncbi:hypothetical protein KR032_011908, partial [Drosophila birchii]